MHRKSLVAQASLSLQSCLLAALWLCTSSQAIAQSKSENITKRLESVRSSRELLTQFEWMLREGRLLELDQPLLPWDRLPTRGWRWEGYTAAGDHLVLAIDGPFVVAIRESHRDTIELSLVYIPNAPPLPTYEDFARTRRLPSPRHVSWMNAKQLEVKDRELAKLYFYFAGPTRSIPSSKVLPQPSWLPPELVRR